MKYALNASAESQASAYYSSLSWELDLCCTVFVYSTLAPMDLLSLPLDGSRSTFQLPAEILELHFSFPSHVVNFSSHFLLALFSSGLCK